MGILATVRAFADRLGVPSFSGTPFPDGKTPQSRISEEMGGTGTFNYGGFIRGEDFNPEMDSLTAVRNLDVMRRSDAQTNSSLQVISQPIRSADKSVDPAGATPEDEAVADFIEWNLFSGESIVWDDFLRQALLMLVFGNYVFEKVWDVQQKGDYKGHLYLRKLGPRPPKTIWQWFTDEAGELISIKQLAVKAGTFQFLDIPVEKLVIFVYNKEGDNYAGMSILRSAYPHWVIKNNLYVVDAIRAVRFGAGIPKAKLQKGYAPNKNDEANLVNTLMGMSSHQFSYIIEPEDVEISILVPQGAQGGAQILPTINHHNEMITRNVMATFLDMGGRSMGGSAALGSSAMDFFTNAVISVADLIEDVVNKQIIVPLVDANFDIDTLSGYPTLRFTGIKQDNLKDMAAVVTSLAGAGMSFSDLETQNTFRNRLGLPELSETELGTEQPEGDPSVEPPKVPTPGGTPPKAVSQGSPSAPKALKPKAAPVNQNAQSTRPVQEPVAATSNVDHTAKSERQVSDGMTAETAQPWDGAAAVSNKPRTVEGMAAQPTRTIPPMAVSRRNGQEDASSGSADEEDHTATTSSPQRSAVLSKGRATTAIPMSETPLEGEFWRQPTELESRVLDLKETPRRLNTARDALLATLRGVREEQILRIAQQVAHLPVGATLPKPPLVGKLVSDALKIVKDVFDFGYNSVESELRKQGASHRAGPVHKELSFADSVDMPWAVELSPVPEPNREEIALAPVQRVNVDKLVATQASLTQRRVLPEGIDTSLPIVVKHNGLSYIYDGHHRLATAKMNGAKQVRVRVVTMREIAFGSPKTPQKALPHLEASISVKIQTASDRLVSSGAAESLRLKRAGWTDEEVEDALKIHLGELSEADLERLSNMTVNEAVSLGRSSAAEVNKDQIGTAVYSALLDRSCCDVCEKLDGEEYDLQEDAEEYEENMPPNANCEGGDQCRCSYIYTYEATALSERKFGGPGSGWHREAGHISHKTPQTALTKSKEKAFGSKCTKELSKLETGALGEHLATLYLKSQGASDARSLNVKGNNFAVDLIQDHHVYEMKAGLASNGKSAQHWRATIGQPGTKEAEWLSRASDKAKAAWNERKSQEILDRKNAAVRQVSKEVGRKVQGNTIGLIINPTSRTVDVHVFKGFHSRIPWGSEQAQSGYKGSFKY